MMLLIRQPEGGGGGVALEKGSVRAMPSRIMFLAISVAALPPQRSPCAATKSPHNERKGEEWCPSKPLL
jgi:hypothetical protein